MIILLSSVQFWLIVNLINLYNLTNLRGFGVLGFWGFVVAGRCGLSVNVMSYAEKISFSIVSDTEVLKDPSHFRDCLEQAI